MQIDSVRESTRLDVDGHCDGAGEGERVKVQSHTELIGDGARGGDGAKRREVILRRVAPQVIEKVRTVTEIAGGEGERVEIQSQAKLVGDDSRGGDRAKRREVVLR